MTNPNAAQAECAVHAEGVAHRYGDHQALAGVDFSVGRGERRGFLGPNGSGKSTLFKLLATILPLGAGKVSVFGQDLAKDFPAIRRRIGVVFQSPALDRKLSVRENLTYGGHLQGMRGRALAARVDEMLAVGNLADRANDVVGTLSGGLRRRVEIAKGLLHAPDLVLLDEPSTGLDPSARQDLWAFLRAQQGLTVLFTTHLMEEAEEADRLTILDRGKVVAEGAPDDLRAELGGEVLQIHCADAEQLGPEVDALLGVQAQVLPGVVRVEHDHAHRLVAQVVDRFGDRLQRVSVAPPSLEDVFIARTGHRLGEEA